METKYVAFFKEVKATKYDSLEQILSSISKMQEMLNERWKLAPDNDDYWYIINVFDYYISDKLFDTLTLAKALVKIRRSIKANYPTRKSQLKVHVVRDVLTAVDIWLTVLDVINDKEQNMRRKRSFMVYQGSIFDGLNGRLYRLTKTKNIIVPADRDGLVDKLLKSWIETGIAEDIGKVNYTSKEPRTADDNLLFRIAMLVQDDELLMSIGTLTYLDDLDCLIKAEVHTTPIPEYVLPMYTVLKAIYEMLDKPEVVKAREHILADLLVDKIVNVTMDEYLKFVGMLHKLYTA